MKKSRNIRRFQVRRQGRYRLVYIRRRRRIQGYTYRRKIKRRWRRIVVSSRYAFIWVLFRKTRLRKRSVTPPVVRKKVPSGTWISRKAWVASLRDQYENFDLTRSDMPVSDRLWFNRRNNFLWRHRKYPPHGPHAKYALVHLYFMVWDPDEKLHKLYAQNLRTIRDTHRATDTNAGLEFLKGIERTLPQKVAERTKMLEDSGFGTEGVTVRGLAAWTLTESLEWWKREEKRRAKHFKYWRQRGR